MDEAEALHREGAEALAIGAYPQAIVALSRALALRPDRAESHALLGAAYAATRCPAAAEDAYREALRLRPGLAEIHLRLMNLLIGDGRPAEALAAYHAARADCPEALQALGRPDAARDLFALAQGFAGLGLPGETAELFEDLARDCPDDPEAYYGLGNALLRLRRPLDALASYRRALALMPDSAKARFAEASPLLMLGEFEAGWAAYEARLDVPGVPWKVTDVRDRLWEGKPLRGRRLLVHVEQGSGDTLQFIRYLPLLRRREGPDARIAVLCEPELARLLAGVEGCEELHAPRQLGPLDYDCQVPLLSLPQRFRTTLDSLPGGVPYLRPPPEAIPPALDPPPDTRLKVGFVWAGRPTHADDRLRSCPVEHFADLFDLPGAAFFALQVGERAGDLAPWLRRPNVSSLGARLGDFADTAAAIDRLDLIIGVDTSVVHLTGALGKPVWTLLAYGGEWRWLLDREDSPWYPTMRLFRQPAPGDWGAVFERVRAELVRMLEDLVG
jgi:tetratricopeptide (TPR) repeat protein